LDIVVNNAEIGILEADEQFGEAGWDNLTAVNLTGSLLCAQAEVQQMIRQ
jgi:NAD(P)-dependent dehydrogenase (short-subunit alcohol dehydrogenase family)